MADSYKISVIVPVYNGENFLADGIKCLLKQSLSDFEIIIINDGSEDKTEEIIKQFAAEYPDRIKWKTVENRGAGIARNHALDMASGEYIAFMDSDDCFEDHALQKLYDKAKSQDADIAVCGYYAVRKNAIRSNNLGFSEQFGGNIHDNPDMYLYDVPFLWNKIVRRELIETEHTRFIELGIFEDLEFIYRLFLQANKIVKVDEPLYYYMKTNENSLTSRFSDKFYDIFEAMDSLIEYFKSKGEYEQFQEHLLFIAMKHMYIRMETAAPMRDFSLKCRFIDDCFSYLDRNFPGWQQHDLYFEVRKRNKKLYTSKLFWKGIAPFVTYGRKFLNFKKAINMPGGFKTGFYKFKKRFLDGSEYLKYVGLPIESNVILIDSQHGDDINGNMFYLIKELQKPMYYGFDTYVAVKSNRYDEFKRKLDFYGFKRFCLVEYNSKKYLNLLATAKILFNDTSFPPYFIKRDQQIYLNTWHGTPLKTLGRKTAQDYYNIANLQKNFVAADYLLYPSKFMAKRMTEDFMTRGVANGRMAMIGYPRNEVFFDKERREKLRNELDFDGKQVIAYMPTWRGTLYNQNSSSYVDDLKVKLEELASGLNENQLLYLNVHPYLKDKIDISSLKNVRNFPKEYETYDFLNTADLLITDYSSVFFDFANSGKQIILFTYDEEEYLEERGLYIDLNELPFKSVKTVEELLKEINSSKLEDYSEFLQEFVPYDAPDVSARICRSLVVKDDDTKREFSALPVPNNGRDNVLCSVNSLSDYSTADRFFKLCEESGECNYYLSFLNRTMSQHKQMLLKLPDGFSYWGMLSDYNCVSPLKRLLLSIVKKVPELFTIFGYWIKKIARNELKCLYADAKFDSILLIGERRGTTLTLFGQMNAKKILCYPEGTAPNMRVFRRLHKMYDRIIVENSELYGKIKNTVGEKAELIEHIKSLDELV